MMDKRRDRRGRACLAAFALAVALASFGRPAFAQNPSDAELKAARELFQEAFKDEQEKRYPEALEKFLRVAKVRESASVRYRIATVLAQMGRLREARDAYRALAASKPSLPASDHDTADSAAERAADLDRKIPRLSLRVQDNPPEDVRVSVDGAPVPVSTSPREIELDPGPHIVAASGRGSAPSETTVKLDEGGGVVPHTVTFTPEKKDTTPPPVETKERKANPMPWVAIGVGAALVVTGGALLLVRESDISEIKDLCPGGVCPNTSRSVVTDKRDQAELFGPLGVGLGVVGVVAVGLGVYLLTRTPAPSTAAVSALLPGGRPAPRPRILPTGQGFALQF